MSQMLMMLKLATKYMSVQADVLSGILLAKNIATRV